METTKTMRLSKEDARVEVAITGTVRKGLQPTFTVKVQRHRPDGTTEHLSSYLTGWERDAFAHADEELRRASATEVLTECEYRRLLAAEASEQDEQEREDFWHALQNGIDVSSYFDNPDQMMP